MSRPLVAICKGWRSFLFPFSNGKRGKTKSIGVEISTPMPNGFTNLGEGSIENGLIEGNHGVIGFLAQIVQCCFQSGFNGFFLTL